MKNIKKAFPVMLTIALCAVILLSGCTKNPNTPKNSPSPAINVTPKISPTPVGAATPIATTNPTAPTLSQSPIPSEIPDFVEGTIVEPEAVPHIVSAIKAKYTGATIKTITHALHLNEKVYEVVFTDSTGVSRTVYVDVTGTKIVEGTKTSASPTVTG